MSHAPWSHKTILRVGVDIVVVYHDGVTYDVTSDLRGLVHILTPLGIVDELGEGESSKYCMVPSDLVDDLVSVTVVFEGDDTVVVDVVSLGKLSDERYFLRWRTRCLEDFKEMVFGNFMLIQGWSSSKETWM